MFSTKGEEKLFDSQFLDLIKQGKSEEALSCIKNQPLHELVDTSGTHLLHVAAKYNNSEIIDCLIESKCKLSVQDSLGLTPLIVSVTHKNFDIAKTLHNAHLNSLKEKSTETPEYEWKYKLETPIVDNLVLKIKEQGWNSEKIGEALAKINCTVYIVVNFHDSVMTKAYLLTTSWVDDNINLYRLFETVGKKHDLQHTLVILKHAPYNNEKLFTAFCQYISNILHRSHKYTSDENFFSPLKLKDFGEDIIDHIRNYHAFKLDRKIVKGIFSLEVFNKVENLKYWEKELQKLPKKSIKTFLKYDFHVIVKATYGRDILACLFGNKNLEKIDELLTEDQIDVDGLGHDGKTPLHFAVEAKLFDNVNMLLDRGANPNAIDKNGQTPLGISLFKKRCDKICKLLLQAGGNPLIINEKLKKTLSKHDFDFKNYRDAFENVVAQLVIYEEVGRRNEKTDELFQQWYALVSKDYLKQCKQQITKIKLGRKNCGKDIKKKRYTEYKIITERPEKLAAFVNKETMQKILKYDDGKNGKKLIPYYCDLLRKRREDIILIRPHRRKVVKLICQITNISDPRHLIVDKIVDYLSLKDLRKLAVKQNQSNNFDSILDSVITGEMVILVSALVLLLI